MAWVDQAKVLLRKAENDAALVSLAVHDAEIADEIVGFHVQQAAEKSIKAVLSFQGLPYRRTHDLQELHDILSDAGIRIPSEINELVGWSPYAVSYRYEDWADPGEVDRTRADELVTAALTWCRKVLGINATSKQP